MSEERCPHGVFRRLVGCAACDWRALAEQLVAALVECSDMLRIVARKIDIGFECLEAADAALAAYDEAKK